MLAVPREDLKKERQLNYLEQNAFSSVLNKTECGLTFDFMDRLSFIKERSRIEANQCKLCRLIPVNAACVVKRHFCISDLK